MHRSDNIVVNSLLNTVYNCPRKYQSLHMGLCCSVVLIARLTIQTVFECERVQQSID
ncbi:hypothetical protein KOR42_15000 [Thalassoglobus neptunius]|uniref:Uncharacterized protein n=1 Tax=Thalassoglobus neptunius TaxID=1938619 RepID=A0A5C5X659_9PLAN|nr:hypothetical protein KOR42_15000 [Thalassoglobus neptunius]